MKFLLLIVLFSLPSFAQDDRVHSAKLFIEAAKVMQHPRCLNCHPNGDRPTQGMGMLVHQMNVKRGKNDTGPVAMQCFACHQTMNNPSSNVPGAPNWHLAPREMAWQGKSVRELCLQLKDKKRNGGRSLDEIVEHSAHDEIVAWGWNPGGNREPVPGTQKEFGETMANWVKTGAHCPEMK
jgi:hypothetical protein